MRTILITLSSYCLLVFVLLSCKKEEKRNVYICPDGNAINYGREGGCVYLSDVFKGEYEAVLTEVDSFPPSGFYHDKYEMSFGDNDYCQFAGVPEYNVMKWTNVRQGSFLDNGGFSGACVYIKGTTLYIPFARLGSDFYLGAFKGQGTFSEKGFTLSGEYVEAWSNEKHTLTLKGTRIVH
jgi:hypothetical protein